MCILVTRYLLQFYCVLQMSFHLNDTTIKTVSTVKATDRTGVEMEALTAVSAAGLVIYDMCKSVDRSMKINNIQLEKKTGGNSATSVAARSAHYPIEPTQLWAPPLGPIP